jgi:hypothetical protein
MLTNADVCHTDAGGAASADGAAHAHVCWRMLTYAIRMQVDLLPQSEEELQTALLTYAMLTYAAVC